MIGHVMILASAGSGKTYQLTDRFVALLAREVPPERIAALTFTRKAAGEFFDEILKKLATAATSEEEAGRIARDIGMPGLSSADFGRFLRAVVAAMPRLNLGTLDGFFARIVRAYPLELGLGGDFVIMEEHAARLARRSVLRRIFSRAAGGSDASRQDFIEAFKRATFGREEKRLASLLDEFLDEHAETYLETSDASVWGEAARIWPEGSVWLRVGPDRAEAALALKEALAGEEMSESRRERWDEFLAALPDWAPGSDLPKPVAYILGNALKVWPKLAEIVVERTPQALGPAALNALRRVVTGIVGGELTRRLEITRGIFAVLREYEARYDGMIRRDGRLTFADLQRLLRPRDGRLLSRDRNDESRLLIDWRLDARIDHWLLDEFQDTSPGQWSVLRNLIDEAVQDPEGRRSFFYVGDVKQAIFVWRSGDPRLFREIFDRYNAGGTAVIAERRLASSHRSGPAVIAMVNRVFGDAEALRRLFPGGAPARWTGEWLEHRTEKPELGGWAELRHAPDEAGRFAETLRIVEEARALPRGMQTAVLVRRNATATALADFLRHRGGLPAVAESDLHVATDNPLGCALLALFRAAAYPGDRAARLLMGMTPLGTVLDKEGLGLPDALTLRILGEVHAAGYGGASEHWLLRLEARLAPDDEFSRERGRQFAAAAREFDEAGGGSVADFVSFMERYTVRDAEVDGVIRVMTVHKAKGLGFDLVILPDLEGETLLARRDGLAVQKSANRDVEWILHPPSRAFAEADPVVGAHFKAAADDAGYENLCLLYVAMTRARRAMYLVTEPVGKSKSANFPRLLQETLGEAWSSGDPRWAESFPSRPAPAPVSDEAPLDSEAAAPSRRLPARRPSAAGAGTLAAAPLFRLEAAGGAEFGQEVHELLARVEWLDTKDAADRAAASAGRGEAGRAAGACLAAPALAGTWRRPGGRAEVWRERAFEVVLDQAWVTGKCDRVVVRRDAAGTPVSATVYDFKTDWLAAEADLEAEAARHRGQIDLYRRAVGVLAGLPIEKVAAEIVFVRALRGVAMR